MQEKNKNQYSFFIVFSLLNIWTGQVLGIFNSASQHKAFNFQHYSEGCLCDQEAHSFLSYIALLLKLLKVSKFKMLLQYKLHKARIWFTLLQVFNLERNWIITIANEEDLPYFPIKSKILCKLIFKKLHYLILQL